jgi:hypothetical protein
VAAKVMVYVAPGVSARRLTTAESLFATSATALPFTRRPAVSCTLEEPSELGMLTAHDDV